MKKNLKTKVVYVVNALKEKTNVHLNHFKNSINQLGAKMIGPIEKGLEKAEIATPAVGSYEGVDLTVLPKAIAFKAALLKEKMALKYVLAAVLFLFVGHYMSARLEVSSLYKKLREKEYILAPGVMDFTTAAPQAVPSSYVNDAVTDFLADLGNINPANVDEQYQSLKRFMSNELKVKFSMETAEWIEQIKSENISQILTVTEKEIVSNDKGAYKVTALARADFYAGQQYLGHEDQVIEMILKLAPPESGKRWYLKITSLTWNKAETFKIKSQLRRGQTSK